MIKTLSQMQPGELDILFSPTTELTSYDIRARGLAISENLKDALYSEIKADHPKAACLAANQIGMKESAFCLHYIKEGTPQTVIGFNPKIIGVEFQQQTVYTGCFSHPFMRVKENYCQGITLVFDALEAGQLVERQLELKGFDAAMVQLVVDNILKGILPISAPYSLESFAYLLSNEIDDQRAVSGPFYTVYQAYVEQRRILPTAAQLKSEPQWDLRKALADVAAYQEFILTRRLDNPPIILSQGDAHVGAEAEFLEGQQFDNARRPKHKQ